MRGLTCLLVVVAACGRLGFDPTRDGGATDGDSDAAIDAASDATIDATVSSRCGGSSVRVCDGFENPNLDPRWLFDNEQGTATVGSVRAYRGSSSLYTQTDEITTPTLYPRGSLYTYAGLPLTGTIDLRVFVYLTAPASPNFLQLINFANAAGVGISRASATARSSTTTTPT